MAISLNDHESRIKSLESRHRAELLFYSGSESSGPGYGETFTLADKLKNYSLIIIEILTSDGYFHSIFYGPQFISSTGNHRYNCTPNWDNYDLIVDLYPSIDGLSIRINDTGVSTSRFKGIHWIYGLTIYYIVRYNIYKLVKFLSHLNTKFGGERR